jgi:hypothetical protein
MIVGPGNQIRKELKRRGITGVKVIEQGESLGENMIKGSRELEADGYENDHILMIGGDVPLATSSSIDEMIDFIEQRGGDPDIFYGVGSRQEVGSFIMEHGLENMGRVGPDYPKKGNLNKFGFPIIDNIPIFGKKGEKTHLMIGNVFIYRRSSINKEFIDKFYRLRKMAANPFTYPYIIYKFGAPMFRAVRWKMTVTDAEKTFARATGVKISLFPVHPEIALDLDSYSDLRRLSALHFHRLGTDKDLEMVLKDFIKKKGSRRKRRRGK